MIILEGIERIYGASDDTGALLFITVSTGEELPDLGGTVRGHVVTAGSYAFILQTGTMYRVDDDGKWYDCDGSGEYTDDRGVPEQQAMPETKKTAGEPVEEPEMEKKPEESPEVSRYDDLDF